MLQQTARLAEVVNRGVLVQFVVADRERVVRHHAQDWRQKLAGDRCGVAHARAIHEVACIDDEQLDAPLLCSRPHVADERDQVAVVSVHTLVAIPRHERVHVGQMQDVDVAPLDGSAVPLQWARLQPVIHRRRQRCRPNVGAQRRERGRHNRRRARRHAQRSSYRRQPGANPTFIR